MKKLGFVIILLIVISHHGLSQIIQKDLNNEKTSLNEKGSGLCWESVGPFDNQIINKDNWIGRVSCLAADPNNQNIIYAGANTGGLWKTTNPLDASPHWECLTDDYAGMGVTDVLIDPNNSNIIYIVTGVHTNTRMHQLGDYKGDYSYGAYKSTDSGLTWNIMFGLDPEDQLYLKKIKYDPNNSNIMYILSSKAVYRSADGGSTWYSTNMPPTGDANLIEIVINPLNSNEIYISGDKGIIFKTNNAGTTWDSINTLGNPGNSLINIAWHPIDSCIYALYWDGSGYGGVLKKSYDRGNSWELVRTIGGVAGWVNALAISPGGIIYAGGVSIFKLDEQGNYTLQSDMHADIRDVLFLYGATDTTEYLATDGGVVRNTTGEDTAWISCNGDLSISQFYDIGITEQDPVILLAGAHDCGTLRRKSNGDWEYVLGGDGSTSEIHPGNCLIQFGSLSGDLRRTDNDWDNNHDPEINFMRYDGPIAFHPGNPNIMYVGDRPDSNAIGHIKKSTTGGTKGSFTDIGEAYGVIYAIEVNESDPNVIYFSNFDWWEAGYSELHKTTDGGISWTRMIQDTEIRAPINAIVTHPDHPGWIWIAFGGLNENKKILYSFNGGASWVNKTHNLENLPVSTMVYDEANKRIIIGNDMGVYYLDSYSTTWKELGSCLPELIVTDLELNKVSGDLFISTYGRGIWKLHLHE